MRLYLIRHAQSENNQLSEESVYRLMRKMDPELTELGQRQAAVLARFLAQGDSGDSFRDLEDRELPANDLPHGRGPFGLTHLYCSLMARAVATGSRIAAELNLPLVAWPDWHEGGGMYLEDPDSGELLGYPGKNRAYFEQSYPELILPVSLDDRGWWNRPFEERPERWERARRVLDELLTRHPNPTDRVGVIIHGGFYNYFIKTLLGIDPEQEIWFVMNNAAITRIDFEAQEIRIIYQNRLDYMPSELLSQG
jgi:2,3-bisphosphoglycerate-dependent phosphoglycerate mutase